MVAAIFNVYDGIELLPFSVSNISPCVEGIIIVYQTTSNTGEHDYSVADSVNYIASITRNNVYPIYYKPDLSKQPAENERAKRELGLVTAKRLGYTHFLDIDCDEFYLQEEFLKEKERVLNSGTNGLICRSQVYFNSPELTIGYDITLVPFLNKVDCNHVLNRNMPYAWSVMDNVPYTIKKQIRVDPTRQLSFTSGIEWSQIVMHHYSYVRKDIKKKIRNSTARQNIEKSTVLNDLLHAKDGYYCEFYGKHLRKCPNVFGIPTWKDLKTTSEDNL
jgi:hypothetical protein